MTKYFFHLVCFIMVFGCGRNASTQNTNLDKNVADIPVGSHCDGCELTYQGMPSINEIPASINIASNAEPGERQELNGKVLMKDGKTPAKDIILYMYHTDANGKYSPADTQTMAKRHGHLRSWVKTAADGSFKIFTIRPASYPNSNIPQHIHIFVKEPGKTVYYIDEAWFDDDPFITNDMKNKSEKRGGNMTLHVSKNNNNIWTGNMKIILGMNIPNYK